MINDLKQFFILIFSEHKICIVGLDNAGKTTILYQFLMNEVVHTSPTIGSNVEEVVWKNVHFIMWDLGGQESLRAAWNTYYSNTEVSCILTLKLDDYKVERGTYRLQLLQTKIKKLVNTAVLFGAIQ